MTRLMFEYRAALRNPWPLLLILIGLLFAALTAWSLQRAQVPGRAATAGYYAKMHPDAAAEWDSRGWTSRFAVDERMFRCELRDNSGLPLSGAQGKLHLSGAPSVSWALLLVEAAPGSYQVELPPDLAGLYSAHLTMVRDGAHLARNLQLQISGY